MLKKTLPGVTWLCIFIMAFVSPPAWPQKPPKRKTPVQLQVATCCEEAKEFKAQITNLSSLLSELSQKQERDWVSVVMQVMELESSTKRMESRLTDAESKYSEMNNQIDIMQLQAAQTVTQTSADAIYDCSSLYQKNYRISGVYKLPPDDFLGSPELEVFCDMETSGGGWTTIQRRKSGLVSFYRDWKQYKLGFGSIRGDFWLGNEHIHRLSRRPTRLRVEMEVSTRPRTGAGCHTQLCTTLGVPFPFLSTIGLCIYYDGFPADCSTVEGDEIFSCFCFFSTKARLQIHKKRLDSGQSRGIPSQWG